MSVAKSNSENKKGVSLFKNGLKTEMLLVGILVILFIFFSVTSPVFLKTDTLMKLLKQASIYGIIAIGMVFVITSSGIDISVGSVVGTVRYYCIHVYAVRNGSYGFDFDCNSGKCTCGSF